MLFYFPSFPLLSHSINLDTSVLRIRIFDFCPQFLFCLPLLLLNTNICGLKFLSFQSPISLPPRIVFLPDLVHMSPVHATFLYQFLRGGEPAWMSQHMTNLITSIAHNWFSSIFLSSPTLINTDRFAARSTHDVFSSFRQRHISKASSFLSFRLS